MTSLIVRNVSKRFEGDSTLPLALKNVGVEVSAGELLVLLGPSGSGKTTLLRAIAGLLSPSDGQIQLGGTLVSDVGNGIDVPPYLRNLGMVFQNFALWPHMTVAENVAYPLRTRKWPAQRLRDRVKTMLSLVQCGHLAERLPGTLSGGQQQRIALARALAPEPALVLFDEPLSNLDALLREDLRQQLREIHRATGFTGVYVTHDQIEALSLGTRIAVMNQGVIEQIGPPEEIYSNPVSEFVARFMGMANAIPFDSATLPAAFPKRGPGVVARFRPDDAAVRLRLAAGNALAPFAGLSLEATVLDRAFLGGAVEYSVKCGDSALKVRMASDGRTVNPGERAILQVHADRMKLFRDGRRIENEEPLLASA